MHDFRCSDPDEMLTEELAEKTRYYKENPKGVRYMCKAMEEMRDEAMERGKEETLIQNVKSLMCTLKLTARQAADALQIPLDQQDKYLSKL